MDHLTDIMGDKKDGFPIGMRVLVQFHITYGNEGHKEPYALVPGVVVSEAYRNTTRTVTMHNEDAGVAYSTYGQCVQITADVPNSALKAGEEFLVGLNNLRPDRSDDGV